MTNVLVFGANGFIGQHLLSALALRSDFGIFAGARKPIAGLAEMVTYRPLPAHISQYDQENLGAFLSGIDVVIYLAASTPDVMARHAKAAAQQAFDDNAKLPLLIAEASAKAGVEKFVFLSSCHVHGALSETTPFHANSPFAPPDDYARSKVAAEELLQSKASSCPTLIIVRPPPVYGVGGKGGLAAFIAMVGKGTRLPFGSVVANRRRYIGVRNLCDFLVTLARDKSSSNETYLVADKEVVSTASFITLISAAHGKSTRVLPVPVWFLTLLAKLPKIGRPINRLIGNYDIDDRQTLEKLLWQPPYRMEDELRQIANRAT